VAATTPQAASFSAWRSVFRSRALSNGIRPEVFDSALAGVGLNKEVLRLDGAQAEVRNRALWYQVAKKWSPAIEQRPAPLPPAHRQTKAKASQAEI
jgi:membrane-bound lytic murein transglycosylase B